MELEYQRKPRMVQAYSERSAVQWCHDPDAASEIDARLERNGFDQVTINAEVFLQAREAFEWFDAMMHAAQSRRIGAGSRNRSSPGV
jgi:hypothetical protein